MVGLLAIGRVHGVCAPHGSCALQATGIQVAVGATQGVAREAHGIGRRACEDGFATANPLAHGAFRHVCFAWGRERSGLGHHGHSLGVCRRRGNLGRLFSLFGAAHAHAIPERTAQASKHARHHGVFSKIGAFGSRFLLFRHSQLPRLKVWRVLQAQQRLGYADAGSTQRQP